MKLRIAYLHPPEGRDYSSKSAVLDDFRRGLSFVMAEPDSVLEGDLVSKYELITEGYDAVHIRYNGCSRVATSTIRPSQRTE